MAVKRQTFDNGTEGATINAANSATSGDAIGTPATQGTGNAVYAAASALLGAKGCRVTGADNDLYNMPLALTASGASASGQIRFTVDSSKSPTIGNLNFARFRAASTNVCIFVLTTARVLVMQNRGGTGIKSFNGAAALPNGTYVLNWQATRGTTTSNGAVNAQLYQLTGGTLTDSYTSPGTNDLGTADIVSLQFGKLTALGTCDFDLDHVLVDNSTTPIPIDWPISAAGSHTQAGIATLTTGGGAGAAGSHAASGSATVTAVGAVSAAGANTGDGTAALTAIVQVSAAGTETSTGSASPAAGYQVTASGSHTSAGSATLAALGVILAAGSETTSGTASVSGRYAVGSAGSETATGAAAVSGLYRVSAAGSSTTAGTATFLTANTVTAAGGHTQAGSAALTTRGGIAAAGSSVANGQVSLTGTARITAAGSSTSDGSALLAGLVVLTAAGASQMAGDAALAQLAMLAAAGTHTSVGSITLIDLGPRRDISVVAGPTEPQRWRTGSTGGRWAAERSSRRWTGVR